MCRCLSRCTWRQTNDRGRRIWSSSEVVIPRLAQPEVIMQKWRFSRIGPQKIEHLTTTKKKFCKNNQNSTVLWGIAKKCPLCILTSFWVLRVSKSWFSDFLLLLALFFLFSDKKWQKSVEKVNVLIYQLNGERTYLISPPFWQYHRNIEINVTNNCHFAFVCLLG